MDKINQVNFFNNPQRIQGSVFVNEFNSENTNVKPFKEVVSDMMIELNEVTNKPNQVTQDVLQGKADISDAMIAVAQSELTVQAATTITGKILQTYEKIMQIQI